MAKKVRMKRPAADDMAAFDLEKALAPNLPIREAPALRLLSEGLATGASRET